MIFRKRVLVCLSGFLVLWAGLSQASEPEIQGVLNLRGYSESELTAIKKNPEVSLWIEMDQSLFVMARASWFRSLRKDRSFQPLPGSQDAGDLFLVSGGHQLELVGLPLRVLLRSGRKALIRWLSESPLPAENHHLKFTPVTTPVALVRDLSRAGTEKSAVELPEVAGELVSGVQAARWMADVERLSEFNRYLASEDMPRVMDWISEQFAGLDGFSVSRHDFSVGSRRGSNIVAEIRGTQASEDIVIVGAHYDSISEDPFHSAPGAEDNASGTAALLEMARIVSLVRPTRTIRFVAFSGEEQGLYGSKAYVQKLLAQGQRVKVALIMDMIGYTSDDDLDCLLETSERNQAVIDVLSEAARAFSSLRMLSTFDYWGSDHVPFLRNQIPATLIIENDYGSYPAYHRTRDLPDLLSLNMGREVLKMNMAGLSYWAY